MSEQDRNTFVYSPNSLLFHSYHHTEFSPLCKNIYCPSPLLLLYGQYSSLLSFCIYSSMPFFPLPLHIITKLFPNMWPAAMLVRHFFFSSSDIKSQPYDNAKPSIDNGNDRMRLMPVVHKVCRGSGEMTSPCLSMYFHNRYQQLGPTTGHMIRLLIGTQHKDILFNGANVAFPV